LTLPPEPARGSTLGAVALVIGYFTAVGAAAVVLLTPSGDPRWALVIAALGCLALASTGPIGLVAARRHGSASRREATGAGVMATSLACGLLLGMGVRGHAPALMLSCLAVAALVGYPPAVLTRRRPRRGSVSR
jgi:hypothetical protein